MPFGADVGRSHTQVIVARALPFRLSPFSGPRRATAESASKTNG